MRRFCPAVPAAALSEARGTSRRANFIVRKALTLYLNSAGRRWKQRREFRTGWNWLLTLLDSSVRFYNHNFTPLRGGVVRVFLRGRPRALYLRLGSSDGAVLEEIFIRKVYEPVFEFLEDAELVVDLGANVGYSVALWRERFPGARVIAVEPDAGNCEMLGLNAGEEGGRVTVVRACLAGAPGRVYLDRSGDACAFSITREAVDGGEPVEARTLPEILDGYAGGRAVDLLKCDIEGAEAEVFASCAGWIRRVRYIIIETHSPYTAGRLAEDIRRGGGRFDLSAVGATGGNGLFIARNLEAPPS